MKIDIIAVGRMKQGPERTLQDRYVDRAAKTGRASGIRHVHVQEIPEAKDRDVAGRRATEGKRLLGLSTGACRIALDETGRLWDTEAFVGFVEAQLARGSDLGFLIGGADGLDQHVIDQSQTVVALGRMTWPHQIARLLLCEQIYRVMTVLSGHPYHRA